MICEGGVGLLPKRLMMKERTLLLYSEVIKQFPEILKIIEENEHITDELIACLSQDEKNFFDNILNQLLKRAINEWKGDPKRIEDMGPNRANWKYCSLDNKPNRLIFYINNNLNGTVLNVGSECIKHFWDFWSNDYEGKTYDQLKQEAGQVRLMRNINDAIPGILRTIDNWNNIVNNCEFILPSWLEDPYLELGKTASALLSNYLNEKENIDYVEKLKSILDEQEKLIETIEEYVSEKASEKHIPRKEVRSWLKIQGLFDVIEMLRKNGLITWGTAHRIGEPSFLKSLIPELNSGLKDLGFKINGIDEGRSGYILEAIEERIKLFSKHKDLIMFCGWLAFDEKPLDDFTMENLLAHCTLNDNKDIHYVLDFIEYKFNISFEEVDLEYNEVYVLDKSTGRFVVDKVFQFANRFKGLIFEAKDITVRELENYISKLPGNRYSKGEIKELKRQRQVFNIEKY